MSIPKLIAATLVVIGTLGLISAKYSRVEFADVFLSDPSIDLGDVLEGPHEVQFRLQNQTGMSIFVDSVSVSCGCSKVEISNDVLETSSSRMGRVILDSTGRSGTFWVSYKLRCCEAGKSLKNKNGIWMVEGRVCANVMPLWRTSKNSVVFRVSRSGNHSESMDHVELDVISVGAKNVKLIGATIKNDAGFLVEARPETNKIIVRAMPQVRPGTRAQIEIRTDCLKRPGMLLPISVE